MYTRWFCLFFSSISFFLFARAASEAHGRNARETVIYIMAGYARSNHKPDYEICANASFGTRASRSESLSKCLARAFLAFVNTIAFKIDDISKDETRGNSCLVPGLIVSGRKRWPVVPFDIPPLLARVSLEWRIGARYTSPMIYIVSNPDICRCSIATNDFVSIYTQSHADEKHSKCLSRHADINPVP